jgi:hypothetical protein
LATQSRFSCRLLSAKLVVKRGVNRMATKLGMLVMIGAVASAAQGQAADQKAPTPAQLLAATAGHWSGKLEYRDYQSNQWFGLPVEVGIVAQPDGATTVRTAAYDDGPKTGTVWITTSTLVDSKAQLVSYSILRRGRAMDTGTAQLSMPAEAVDMNHWTLVTTERRPDGNAIAHVRETTTRNGDHMMTLKEVDMEGDGKVEWLPRNRTQLTLKR